MAGPTAYIEIRRAAMVYRGRHDDDHYAHTLNSRLRESLHARITSVGSRWETQP